MRALMRRWSCRVYMILYVKYITVRKFGSNKQVRSHFRSINIHTTLGLNVDYGQLFEARFKSSLELQRSNQTCFGIFCLRTNGPLASENWLGWIDSSIVEGRSKTPLRQQKKRKPSLNFAQRHDENAPIKNHASTKSGKCSSKQS